jgi:hypothetical protein
MNKPKRPRDPSQLAKLIVDIATGEAENDKPDPNPKGRAGGLKGGKARADAMSAEERKAAAEKAAKARWKS